MPQTRSPSPLTMLLLRHTNRPRVPSRLLGGAAAGVGRLRHARSSRPDADNRISQQPIARRGPPGVVAAFSPRTTRNRVCSRAGNLAIAFPVGRTAATTACRLLAAELVDLPVTLIFRGGRPADRFSAVKAATIDDFRSSFSAVSDPVENRSGPEPQPSRGGKHHGHGRVSTPRFAGKNVSS